jgi:hypothetical protein
MALTISQFHPSSERSATSSEDLLQDNALVLLETVNDKGGAKTGFSLLPRTVALNRQGRFRNLKITSFNGQQINNFPESRKATLTWNS